MATDGKTADNTAGGRATKADTGQTFHRSDSTNSANATDTANTTDASNSPNTADSTDSADSTGTANPAYAARCATQHTLALNA